MAAAVTKSVLVSYLDRPSGLDDLQFLESEFKTSFSFQKNVRLCVTFQRYDKDWEEYVDLEPTDIIENKDKLRAGMGSITYVNNELLLRLPVNSIYYITITITHSVICNILLYYYS